MELNTNYWTYKQIEEHYNLSNNSVRGRVYSLGIKPLSIGGRSFFTPNQVNDIVTFSKPRPDVKHKKIKLSIIEEYIRCGSARKTAKFLGIQKKYATDTVKEWQENKGYVVVESSINVRKDSIYKNIYKIKGKWNYTYTHKGKKYYKSGIETEDEAHEQLLRLKEKLKLS